MKSKYKQSIHSDEKMVPQQDFNKIDKYIRNAYAGNIDAESLDINGRES